MQLQDLQQEAFDSNMMFKQIRFKVKKSQRVQSLNQQ